MENNSNDGTNINADNEFKKAAQDVDAVFMRVDETAQRRPSVRFGVIVLAVGIGSYFGAGRHVSKLGKDVKVLRDIVGSMGELMVAESNMRDAQAQIVSEALSKGRDVRFFPGLGVWVEGVGRG